MSSEVVPTSAYVKELKRKYKDLDIPTYKLKKWFSTSRRIFLIVKTKTGMLA